MLTRQQFERQQRRLSVLLRRGLVGAAVPGGGGAAVGGGVADDAKRVGNLGEGGVRERGGGGAARVLGAELARQLRAQEVERAALHR